MNFKDALVQSFNDLMSLSEKEFEVELEKRKDSDLTKVLYHANMEPLNSGLVVERYTRGT